MKWLADAARKTPS